MREFRSSPESNVDDLLKYMRHTQYLDMAEIPVHATAALYLAETFQLNDLYKQAFAHCVGMHDRLFYTSEYQVGNNPVVFFLFLMHYFSCELGTDFVSCDSLSVRYREHLSAGHAWK